MTRCLALVAFGAALMVVATIVYASHRRPLSNLESSCHAYSEPEDGVPVRFTIGPPYPVSTSNTLTWEGVVAWEAEPWPHPLAHD